MNLQAIISAIGLIGSDLPAFKSLFDTVIGAFDEKDQAVLKQTYSDMQTKSNAAHEAAQEFAAMRKIWNHKRGYLTLEEYHKEQKKYADRPRICFPKKPYPSVVLSA